MSRSATGALLASLLVFGASATVAQEPTAGEEVAARTVEIPEAGIAVTLSSDWRIWSEQDSGHGAYVATRVASQESCDISAEGGFGSAEEAAADLVESLDSHPTIEILEHSRLEIPVGDAVLVVYGSESSPFYLYYVTGPQGVARVECFGEAPADRWLDIIESIEPLSASTAESAPFEPRVEVPGRGFAIDFTADWLVGLVSRGPVFGGDFVLRAQSLGEDSADCQIEASWGLPGSPEPRSTEGWIDALVGIAGTQRRTTAPAVSEVDLPSGRSFRLDWQRWRGSPLTAWAFIDGDRRLLFFCRSEEPPTDGWLSIAETFEFLPIDKE